MRSLFFTVTSTLLNFTIDSIIAYSRGETQWLAPREKTSKCSRQFVPFHYACEGQSFS